MLCTCYVQWVSWCYVLVMYSEYLDVMYLLCTVSILMLCTCYVQWVSWCYVLVMYSEYLDVMYLLCTVSILMLCTCYVQWVSWCYVLVMYSEYLDVMYFSAVRWLSRAVTLKRFWNLRHKFFMESKHQNVVFLSDENWLNDLPFLTDITQHLSDLNLRLQRKNQLVNQVFEHIFAFEMKLELFQVQLSRATWTHFMCLSTRKLEFPDVDCTKYGVSV